MAPAKEDDRRPHGAHVDEAPPRDLLNPTAIERATAAAHHSLLQVGTFFVLPLLLAFHAITSAFRPPSPFVREHLKQAAIVHGVFGLVSVVTCGGGLVVLAVPVWVWSRRAEVAARAGIEPFGGRTPP